jgi:hypothetical protein
VRTLILALIALHVSDRGGKFGFVYRSRQNVYRALRRQGKSKETAARIANAGRSHAARSRMSRKGARKRRKR